MKMDSKPMYSWWAESHNNTPKQSVWLQTALNELDEKTKAMLGLIEEEADSFAQRVELYYKKRPELIGRIEQFYRAYRSLASRYDLLKAKIKLQELTAANSQQQPQQKSQSDSQVKEQQQEEPQSQQTPATLHSPILITSEALMETPFGKAVVAEDDSISRGFKRLVRRYDTCDSESESTSEVEDAEPEAKNNAGVFEQDSEVTSICSSSFSDGDSESSEGKIKVMETVISNLDKKNVKLVRQLNMKNHQLKLLREEVGKLKKEKSFWKEECTSQARKKTLLEKDIQMFRAEYSKIWNSNDLKVHETQALQEKIDFLQKENNNLSKTNVVLSAVLEHINEQKDSFDRKLKEDTTRLYEEKINVEKMLEAEKQSVSEHIQKLEHFEKEIYRLCEENKERGEELMQRNEEKIEAIRQLSVAMESLRVENKMLEATLMTVRSASKKTKTTNNKNSNLLWRMFSMPF